MLVLDEKAMRSCVTCHDMIESVEKAFLLYAQKECNMIARMIASFGDNTMIYMPCQADGLIGTKILAEFPENSKHGLPYLNGIMILNDENNGKICAIMDGSVLTALRTGAIGGLAARSFSCEKAQSLGLIGCGVQGLHQLMFVLSVRKINRIYLYNRGEKDYGAFMQNLKALTGIEDVTYIICRSADEVLKSSEIIITATQSRVPLFQNEEKLFYGKCIIAIGSWRPFMRELPDAAFRAAERIITDLPFALDESGDFTQTIEAGIVNKEQIEFMGDVLLENKEINKLDKGKTIIYKSVGMSVLDVVAAKKIYCRAKECGTGTLCDSFGMP